MVSTSEIIETTFDSLTGIIDQIGKKWSPSRWSRSRPDKEQLEDLKLWKNLARKLVLKCLSLLAFSRDVTVDEDREKEAIKVSRYEYHRLRVDLENILAHAGPRGTCKTPNELVSFLAPFRFGEFETHSR
jgi:hypothetical protein